MVHSRGEHPRGYLSRRVPLPPGNGLKVAEQLVEDIFVSPHLRDRASDQNLASRVRLHYHRGLRVSTCLGKTFEGLITLAVCFGHHQA